MPSKAKRILLLYSATGNGHRSVAQAIHDSINKLSDSECREVEVFSAVRPPLIGGWPAAYSWMATRSVWLYDVLFFLADTHWASTRLSSGIYLLAKRKISRVLREIDPNVIVITSPFVGEVAARARNDFGAGFRIVNVVCDLVTPHASWACREADTTVVCSPFAKKRLLKAGVRQDSIRETLFPVQNAFYDCTATKEHYRRELGLQVDRFTIVLSGGSLGAGPVLSSARALSEAFPQAQLLIVAGYNTHLQSLLRTQFRQENVRVYGFTDQMPALVHSSDVVVAKGGPSSIMEAYVSQRPVIVIGEVGTQERGNGRLVEHMGIGFYAGSANVLVSTVESLRRSLEARKLELPGPAVSGSDDIAKLVLSSS